MVLTGLQLIDRTRRYVDDLVEPFLFPTNIIEEALTEAERELALVGKLLRETVTYQVAAGDRWVYLQDEPEVIEFKHATLIDANNKRYPLTLQGTMDSGFSSRRLDYGVWVNTTEQLTPGRPQTLYFGKESGAFELSPPANDTYTIECVQLVYPADPITKDTAQPTIAERHHPAIAIGAAVRLINMDLAFDNNRSKIESLEAAWQRALIRAAQESGAIMRDAGVVQFSNSYW